MNDNEWFFMLFACMMGTAIFILSGLGLIWLHDGHGFLNILAGIILGWTSTGLIRLKSHG